MFSRRSERSQEAVTYATNQWPTRSRRASLPAPPRRSGGLAAHPAGRGSWGSVEVREAGRGPVALDLAPDEGQDAAGTVDPAALAVHRAAGPVTVDRRV